MKILRSHLFNVGSPQVRELISDDGQKRHVVEGYAAKFNSLSELMWDFREIIAPGAFDGVLDDDVRALFNHDANLILGRSASKTLKIFVDEIGLKYEVELPDTTYANDLMKSMQRGDVNQSSFAFSIAPGGAKWENVEGGTYLRTILKIERLYDVSPVTYPAYPDATSNIRSALDDFKQWSEQQAAERDRQEYKQQADSRRRRLTIIGK